MVKNLPATWETWLLSLDGSSRDLSLEDPLEKEMAAHSNILAWSIPWGHKELDMTERLTFSLHFAATKDHLCPNEDPVQPNK